MINYGRDYVYANERVANTFVLKDDELVFVHSINGRGRVTYSRYGAMGDAFHCELDELNLYPPALGYINYLDTAIYVMRFPNRQYKQGLKLDLLNLQQEHHFPLFQCIRGEYPSLESTVESLYNKECSKRAFSRRYALAEKVRGVESFDLVYKDIGNIGTVTVKNLNIKLNDKYEFLQEDLHEALQ